MNGVHVQVTMEAGRAHPLELELCAVVSPIVWVMDSSPVKHSPPANQSCSAHFAVCK